jgi:hypothetical protein
VNAVGVKPLAVYAFQVTVVPLTEEIEMTLGAEEVLPMAQQVVVLLHTSWVREAVVTPL